MDTKRAIIEQAEQAIDRAKSLSKQPRFDSNKSTEGLFFAVTDWLKRAKELAEPEYRPDSRKRDEWLQQFWKLEPHWAGIVQQTVMIDSNRGWMLIGGRNQVRSYTNILHAAENGAGWRTFIKKASTSFRTSDMCTVVEVGRRGKNGPMRAIYNVDPTCCRLTGNTEYPLNYYPTTGGTQRWRTNDFFRATAMSSDNERFHGLGYCATSIALELVKLLYGVLTHDQEMVGARMPEGLLLLQGIGQTQWDQVLDSRDSQLDAKLRRYFGGLIVLATSGSEQVDARLISLSQLPANFDRKTFIDQIVYGYATIVGYPAGEFWPVTGSVLGRGKEEEQSHMRATTKGGMDFALSFQEQLQLELPPSLHYEFEARDDEGELISAQVSQAWAEVANTLYTPPSQFDPPLLTREQAMSLLVEHGIIPSEWTEQEEKEIATDTETAEVRALDMPEVRRACETFPDEPIIKYRWNGMRGYETTLWESGAAAMRPRLWRNVKVARQDDSEVLFEGDGITITEADVDRAITDGERRLGEEYAGLLTATEVEE